MCSLPILYSFRRCPYAIRARMAIYASGTSVALREVVLRDKPLEMLACSPKGTVPVLQLANGTVYEESADIVDWALGHADPERWLLSPDTEEEGVAQYLVQQNDGDFKQALDRYKYYQRHPEHDQHYYRQQVAVYLQQLEELIEANGYLVRDTPCIADIMLFPFIRQCAFVDKTWFDGAPYPHLQQWLAYFLQHDLFLGVMQKYAPWETGQSITVFARA